MRLFRISSRFLNQATKRVASAIIVFSVFALLLLTLVDRPLLLTISILGISALVGFRAAYAGHRIRKTEVAFDIALRELSSDAAELEKRMNIFLQEIYAIDDPSQRSQNLRANLQSLKVLHSEIESELEPARQELEKARRASEWQWFQDFENFVEQKTQLLSKIDEYIRLIASMLASEGAEHSDKLH
jgi:hypothetical protein